MEADLQHRIDALFDRYRRADAPGGTAAVTLHGRVVHRSAFGLASVEHGVAMQPETLLPIASISKHITCAALLLLAGDQRLSLDDAVGRWVDGLPPAQQRATLRQLMTHTAGIRCYLDTAVFNGYATMPAGVPLATQRRQTSVNFEPGHGSAYCNGGYLLLALAVERCSGLPFETFLQTRLFAPADLRATRLPRWRWPLQPGAATSYLPYGTGWRHGMSLSEEFLGDGGIVSTADDLLRWAHRLQRGTGTIALDDLAPALVEGELSAYGFGLISETWRGLRVVNHAGGLPGSSALLLMVPAHGIDIALLFNRNAPTRDIALQIVELLLGDQLPAALAAPRSGDWAALLGEYLQPDTGLLFGLRDIDGTLGLSLFGAAPFALDGCAADGTALPFWADVGTGAMRFRPAADDNGIEVFNAGAWWPAQRLDTAANKPSAGQFADAAAGAFFSTEAAATLRVVHDGDGLQVHFSGDYGNGRYEADVLAPDLARFWPALFPGGMLLRLEHDVGSVARAVVSTGRSRRTVFARSGA